MRARTDCLLELSRRGFLAATGGLALAAAGCRRKSLLELTSSLLDEHGVLAEPIRRARIRVGFIAQIEDRKYMGWPGKAYDLTARRREYEEILARAAHDLEVDLDVWKQPIHDDSTTSAFLESVGKDAPDGILITIMDLNRGWDFLFRMAPPSLRGNVPLAVFSPMGTSFSHHLHMIGVTSRFFLGSTQEPAWLADALKLLRAVHVMKHTRILFVAGEQEDELAVPVVGTTVRHIPAQRFPGELEKVRAGEQVRAIADHWARKARRIVEPSREEILEAVKNYVVIRRLMAAENCHGFTMDCLNLIYEKKIDPPCLAYAHMRDEGIVAACEGDVQAAISSRLAHLLLDRPGFQANPVVNTVKGTLMAAHCTCPTRLAGFDEEPAPFLLRSHAESNRGVSLQVIWRKGQRVTTMKLDDPVTMLLATGTVVDNIDNPPSGGCRTSIEIEIDDMPPYSAPRGFHHIHLWGEHEGAIRAWCRLAGVSNASLWTGF